MLRIRLLLMSTILEVLHTGTVIVDKTLPYHRPEDPPLAWTHAFRKRGDLIAAPVSAYLVENRHGLTLIVPAGTSSTAADSGRSPTCAISIPSTRRICPRAGPLTSSWRSGASAPGTSI